MLRSAILGALLVVALGLLPAAGAAQDESAAKPRTLTVQVFVQEEGRGQPDPARRAVVRVEGSEDSFETNDRGMARISGVSAEKVKLQVMVVGSDICRLSDVAVPVPVPAGETVVKVLVEKSGRGPCKLVVE